MKIFRGIKLIIFPIRNVKRALGIAELKESIGNAKGAAKEIFKPKKNPIVKESFEEAVVRLQLTEEMLLQRRKNLLLSVILYMVLSIASCIYAVYLLFTGLVLGAFISFVLTLIALGFCYRDHFWYVQIKSRRLGMRFKEWANYTLEIIRK